MIAIFTVLKHTEHLPYSWNTSESFLRPTGPGKLIKCPCTRSREKGLAEDEGKGWGSIKKLQGELCKGDKAGTEIQNKRAGSSSFRIFLPWVSEQAQACLSTADKDTSPISSHRWIICVSSIEIYSNTMSNTEERLGVGVSAWVYIWSPFTMACSALPPIMYVCSYKGLKEIVSRDLLHKYAYYYLCCLSHTK